MNAAIEIIGLVKELASLAKDVIEATDKGEILRIEDILPGDLKTTIAKAIADGRARVKYGDPR